VPERLFQEPGSRPSRALPYVLDVEAAVQPGSIALTFRNSGSAGAVFHVYDKRHLDRIPRRYTVEAGHALTDQWPIADRYDLWVLGPNGFVRGFEGEIADGDVTAALIYRPGARRMEIALRNAGAGRALILASSYQPQMKRQIALAARASQSIPWDVSRSGNWYDLSIAADRGFVRRFAGRLETGKDSVSDPAMGAV
jgi:phospholipase C